MLDLYKEKLTNLISQSKDKGPTWIGWTQIETLEEIIAKYKLFDEVS